MSGLHGLEVSPVSIASAVETNFRESALESSSKVSSTVTALEGDETTTNDTTTLENLPISENNPVTGTGNIRVRTANLRALGIAGMDSGLPGGVNGIIGLNISQINLSRASIDPSKYDHLSTTEHEIDEVLGLGSYLDAGAADPLPEDLFRYTSAGSRTFTTNGDDACFSIDGTNLLDRYNQNPAGDRGDWWTECSLRIRSSVLRVRIVPCLRPDGDLFYFQHAPDPKDKPLVLLHCPVI